MGRKVKVVLPKLEVKEIDFCNKKIKIYTIISIENYEKILSDIKSTIIYNNDVEDKYGLLHIRYIKDVLDLCTNIDTSDFTAEDLNSDLFVELLDTNISNFYKVQKYIEKEYEKWLLENCFGILGDKMPTTKEIEESMKNISETINNLPSDKLELISKSIVWNNMPALGNQVAPASHKEVTDNTISEA